MLSEGSIQEVWGAMLDSLDNVLRRLGDRGELARITERRLRESLKKEMEAESEEPSAIPQRGDVGIFDPKARGGCVRLLLVPCSSWSFYERIFDVLDIAQRCQPRLEGVMFLPVEWHQAYEQRLATHVPFLLRKYGVKQVCVKFPLLAQPRCY